MHFNPTKTLKSWETKVRMLRTAIVSQTARVRAIHHHGVAGSLGYCLLYGLGKYTPYEPSSQFTPTTTLSVNLVDFCPHGEVEGEVASIPADLFAEKTPRDERRAVWMDVWKLCCLLFCWLDDEPLKTLWWRFSDGSGYSWSTVLSYLMQWLHSLHLRSMAFLSPPPRGLEVSIIPFIWRCRVSCVQDISGYLSVLLPREIYRWEAAKWWNVWIYIKLKHTYIHTYIEQTYSQTLKKSPSDFHTSSPLAAVFWVLISFSGVRNQER